MIKLLVLSGICAIVLSSSSDCGNKNSGKKYQGRLEVKGICSNYTIAFISGNIDPASVVEKWTDEVTNKSYANVFALKNPCDFPDSIKQGDSFYFVIDTATGKDCMVCMAYYPKPSKKLSIKVVPE